jgi:hypothetical protein
MRRRMPWSVRRPRRRRCEQLVALQQSSLAAAHSIGFLPTGGASGRQKILGLGEAQADASRKNARINVALNALRVADYPGDEAFLDFLEGDTFKSGLKLATTTQPAIAPLAGMALALTKSIAKRSRNVSVQDCYLGLDFAGTAMGARLAAGDYIAVQIPESLQRVWFWDDWVYEPRTGLIEQGIWRPPGNPNPARCGAPNGDKRHADLRPDLDHEPAGFTRSSIRFPCQRRGAQSSMPAEPMILCASGRTPTEVVTVESNATRSCDVSAWLLGENGKDG